MHRDPKSSTRHRARRTHRVVGALLAVGLAATAVAGCRVPPSLTVTVLASGLSRPWDLAFTPGRQIIFTERTGAIRIRTNEGAIRTLATPSDVLVSGEGGMLGVAIDPQFATNRRIYTCFVSNRGAGGRDVRLVRWRVNEAVTGLDSRTDIVTGIPNVDGRHSGCRPRFGPDGNIWMGTGDAGSGPVPQSPTSLGGKVLRVNTNGAGVAGNMTAPFDTRIYTYGHRNVQGMAFSANGRPFAVEHGTHRDDEVNLLVAGANYGWDPRPVVGGSGYDDARPMTDTTRFPNARRPVWTSGASTIAPSGATFLTGSQWGGWHNTLAMAVLKGNEVRVLAFDSATQVEAQWTRITDRGRIRAAVQGPDGSLYLLTDAASGQLLRVTPTA